MSMVMYVLLTGLGCSGRCYELAVLDAFHADEPVGELPDAPVRAAQDQGLEALVLVQVPLRRRANQVKGLMLRFGEFAAEIWNVMIVYERNACHRFRRFISEHFFSQGAAREVPQCFRARCIALSLDELVEFDQEVFLHRN